MTEYNPKLVTMPGVNVSPEVLLHRTLQKLDHIKAVAVVIQWKDDSMSTDWSSMKRSELIMAAKVLDRAAEEQIFPPSHEQPDHTRPA